MPWEALGAFLSGIGSVIGAGYAIKRTVRHMEKQCELQMKAYRDGLREGRDQRREDEP